MNKALRNAPAKKQNPEQYNRCKKPFLNLSQKHRDMIKKCLDCGSTEISLDVLEMEWICSECASYNIGRVK